MYKIRLHVVRTANDDGSEAATVTPTGVTALVDIANQIYAAADVRFEFDETLDFTHINSTLLNQDFTPLVAPETCKDPDVQPKTANEDNTRALYSIRDLYPTKLLIFFSHRSSLSYNTSLGHWVMSAGTAHSSSGLSSMVRMLSYASGTILAHELGHFMQNIHTFGSRPATVADAAKIIKDYVEGGGQPKDNGLLALDGDYIWVTDTPADAGTAIFADAKLSECGTNGKVKIPVHFSDGTNRTYDLEPDRTNVMSYFGCTNLANPVRLSSQQARRVKDGIETGIRSRLVALKGGEIAGKLKKKGSAHAGSISDVQLANIGDGRVVSAVINGSDELELITWQVSADGETITRKGKATGPACKKISIVNLGLGMVATGVRTASDNLKINLWKVDADGNIKRKKDDEGGGVKDLRLARVAKEYVAAACRLMDDSFKLIVWHVTASGDIERHGSATAGTVTALAAISEHPIYFAKEGREAETFGPVLTTVRDGSDNLLLINWIISSDGGTVTRGGEASAGKVKGISAGYLPFNQCVTPVVDSDDELRIISWNLSAEGRVIDRWDTTQAGAISEVDCAGLGFDLFLTTCRQADGKTKTILWRSVAGGAAINRVDDVVTGAGSHVRVTQVFPSVAAVAMRDGAGNLSLTAFRIS